MIEPGCKRVFVQERQSCQKKRFSPLMNTFFIFSLPVVTSSGDQLEETIYLVSHSSPSSGRFIYIVSCLLMLGEMMIRVLSIQILSPVTLMILRKVRLLETMHQKEGRDVETHGRRKKREGHDITGETHEKWSCWGWDEIRWESPHWIKRQKLALVISSSGTDHDLNRFSHIIHPVTGMVSDRIIVVSETILNTGINISILETDTLDHREGCLSPEWWSYTREDHRETRHLPKRESSGWLAEIVSDGAESSKKLILFKWNQSVHDDRSSVPVGRSGGRGGGWIFIWISVERMTEIMQVWRSFRADHDYVKEMVRWMREDDFVPASGERSGGFKDGVK